MQPWETEKYLLQIQERFAFSEKQNEAMNEAVGLVIQKKKVGK